MHWHATCLLAWKFDLMTEVIKYCGWIRNHFPGTETQKYHRRHHCRNHHSIVPLFPVSFLQINIIAWFSIMSTRANRKVRFYSLLLMFFILLVFCSPREDRSERESECRLQCPNGGEWNQIAETWFSYLSRKQFPFHVVQRIFTYILPLCNQDNPVRYWLRRLWDRRSRCVLTSWRYENED